MCGLSDVFPKRTATPEDAQHFTLFILMHLYFYAHAIDAADVVIDTTALATDPDLRRSVEDELSRLALGPIDLSDARPCFDASIVSVSDRSHFVDTIEQFVKLITSTCSSERAAAFVVRLKDETLAEWDRHDSFTRRSTAWHRQEAEKLQLRLEQQAAGQATAETGMAALTGERDDLAGQLTAMSAARDAAKDAVAALTGEWDDLAGS